MSLTWREKENGNWVLWVPEEKSCMTVFLDREGDWRWVFNGQWSKSFYHMEDAKEDAEEFLENELGIESESEDDGGEDDVISKAQADFD